MQCVDYLFGKTLVIESTASDPDRRATISELLRLILAHTGGILFLRQLALLGSVYGFVDVRVKLTDMGTEEAGVCGTAALGAPPSGEKSADAQQQISQDAGPAPEVAVGGDGPQ